MSCYGETDGTPDEGKIAAHRGLVVSQLQQVEEQHYEECSSAHNENPPSKAAPQVLAMRVVSIHQSRPTCAESAQPVAPSHSTQCTTHYLWLNPGPGMGFTAGPSGVSSTTRIVLGPKPTITSHQLPAVRLSPTLEPKHGFKGRLPIEEEDGRHVDQRQCRRDMKDVGQHLLYDVWQPHRCPALHRSKLCHLCDQCVVSTARGESLHTAQLLKPLTAECCLGTDTPTSCACSPESRCASNNLLTQRSQRLSR
jgi:hypothetical protein